MEGVTFRRCKDILCHDQCIRVLSTSVQDIIGLAQGWTRKVGTSADVNFIFCTTLIFRRK